MDTDFEIATFEYSDLYDSSNRVPKDQVVNQFIKQYIRYLSPEYYAEDDICFSKGRLWFSCSDKTGGDKPMTIMLIGPITDDLIKEIKEMSKTHPFEKQILSKLDTILLKLENS